MLFHNPHVTNMTEYVSMYSDSTMTDPLYLRPYMGMMSSWLSY